MLKGGREGEIELRQARAGRRARQRAEARQREEERKKDKKLSERAKLTKGTKLNINPAAHNKKWRCGGACNRKNRFGRS